ncbi:MAG: hypothetical protein C4B58_15805 [Deltaproteobacteria bacterium]|nr:MAG: hypothetical protein C4B58_15805 [Deltaproteobacteria bacterium]
MYAILQSIPRCQLQPIGCIYSPYRTKEECPIQPVYSSASEGRIEVFEKYSAGLKGIETFSHIYILYIFHRAGEVQLIRPTPISQGVGVSLTLTQRAIRSPSGRER